VCESWYHTPVRSKRLSKISKKEERGTRKKEGQGRKRDKEE